MKKNRDAYGEVFLAQLNRGYPTTEIIERDDGFFDTGSFPGTYFREYKDWPLIEKRAIRFVRGRALDIGCGAGRQSLYLQDKGFKVTGMDASSGAVKVCRKRGLKSALVRRIGEIGKFRSGTFDSVLMFGNNLGLLGNVRTGKELLRKFHRITSANGRIIGSTMDPYRTSNAEHLAYQDWNRRRGRLPGQIRMRVRFERAVSEWLDCLFISKPELEALLDGTGWRIERVLESKGPAYFAVIGKERLTR